MGARSTPNVYQPATGDALIAGGTAIQEFFGFVGDCGEAAAEILYSWSQGKAPSGEHINAVVRAMQSAGLAGNQGISSLGQESTFLRQEGVPNMTTGNWLGAIQQNAGRAPVELLVFAKSLGAALPGDEFGVHGHFITVEGYSPAHNAYIVSDPDNAAAKRNQLVYYSQAQLEAANPEGAIVPTGTGRGIAGGGPGTGTGGIGTVLGSVQQGVGAATGAAGAALGGDSISTLLGAAKAGLAETGIFVLALAAIALGALLIFWEPISGAAKSAAGGARDAVVAGVAA